MSLEHLDAWQSRVLGLSLPLHTVKKFNGITRGHLMVKFGGMASFSIKDPLGGMTSSSIKHPLGVSTQDTLFDTTHLILEDRSTIRLRGLWGTGLHCPRRSSLEESISCMYSSEFVEDSARVLLTPIVRQLDFTKRCLRMLQRYPEGVMGWLGGDDMKPFRVLVYEMFLEGA